MKITLTNMTGPWFTCVLVLKWLHYIFYEGLPLLWNKKLFHSGRHSIQITGYIKLRIQYVRAIYLHLCMNKAIRIKTKVSWSSSSFPSDSLSKDTLKHWTRLKRRIFALQWYFEGYVTLHNHYLCSVFKNAWITVMKWRYVHLLVSKAWSSHWCERIK